MTRRVPTYFVLMAFFAGSALHAEDTPVSASGGANSPDEQYALKIARRAQYASLLFLGLPEKMALSSAKVAMQGSFTGKHYVLSTPIYEYVIAAETGCMVRFISRDIEPINLDHKPNYSISKEKDRALSLIKNAFFMRLSGLEESGIIVDETAPAFEERHAGIEFPRMHKGIPVHEESIYYGFSPNLESLKIARVYATVTFGKAPEEITPKIKEDAAFSFASNYLKESDYAKAKNLKYGVREPAYTLKSSRLSLVHPNAALSGGEFDLSTYRDSPLALAYVLEIHSQVFKFIVFVDAGEGKLLGGERFGD